MDAIVDTLAAQQAELAGLLADLEDAGWSAPTRCEGWDVADVVLHLAQTDELAVGSARGRFTAVAAELTEGAAPVGSVDDGATLMVARASGVFPAGPCGRAGRQGRLGFSTSSTPWTCPPGSRGWPVSCRADTGDHPTGRDVDTHGGRG